MLHTFRNAYRMLLTAYIPYAYKRIHFLMVARIHVFNRAGILKLASASFSSKNWVLL